MTVNSSILFTNWQESIIGSTTKFEAFSTTPNVNWTINVYDVVDDLVISQSGHSLNGRIEWTWNLVDSTGLTRNDWEYDPFFYSEITVSSAGGGTAAAATPKRTPIKALDYPAEGKWLVAFQDRVQGAFRQDFVDAMNAIAGGPALYNILYELQMHKYGTNVTQAERDSSWLDFRAAMTGSAVRNLYYQGHGNPNTIGGDYDLFVGTNMVGSEIARNSKAYLTSEWVKRNITFNKYSGAKYFRFIWFDGCETAKGGWPGAFGIPKSTNTLAYYQAPNRKPNTRPSAFVGWEQLVGGGPQWGTTASYKNFRTQWMFLWSSDAQFSQLDEAFSEARRTSGWISQALMDTALRIYGYNDLEFRQYNRRTDWLGP